MDPGAGAGMVDGVKDGEQLACLVAVAKRGESEDRPDGSVGVLAAVLADARQIALDVAWIDVGLVERWREQEDETVTASNEVFLDRGHRPLRVGRIGGSREDTPRLGDRVDAALDVHGGAKRGAIVEEGSAVPVAVPAVALDRPPERLHVGSPALRARTLTAGLRDRREGGHDGVQEPAQPDALAPALVAHPVHPVVPVARPDER